MEKDINTNGDIQENTEQAEPAAEMESNSSDEQVENAPKAEDNPYDEQSEPVAQIENNSSKEQQESEQETSGDDNLSSLLADLSKEDASYLEEKDIEEKKPFNKKVLIIIIGALIVAAGLIVGLFIWSNPPKTGEMGNTSGNLANLGIAAEKDGWTYYSSAELDEKSQSQSVRIDKTNGKETKTVVEEGGYYINVLKDYVYYIHYSDSCIYRVKTDGTQKTKLTTERCINLLVKGNYIYYINYNDFSVHSMRLNGNDNKKISPEGLQVLQFEVKDDGFYYIGLNNGQYHLYKADFNFQNAIMIVKDDQVYSFQIQEKSIYYMTMDEVENKNASSSNNSSSGGDNSNATVEYVLYKSDINGKNPVKIVSDGLRYAVYNGYVYYINAKGKMFRIKEDGSDNKDLGVTAFCINVANDFIYYINNSDYLIYKMNPDGTDSRVA